ncbi:hypothetical protein D3C71_1875120 [compost metagenome]
MRCSDTGKIPFYKADCESPGKRSHLGLYSLMETVYITGQCGFPISCVAQYDDALHKQIPCCKQL